jgi:hypothetical protein
MIMPFTGICDVPTKGSGKFRSSPFFSITINKMWLLLFGLFLSLLSMDFSQAAVVSSDWIGGISGTGNWSVKENWNPEGVPNNGSDTYRVNISGTSSEVYLDQNTTIEDLNLGNGKLLISGWSLKLAEGGGGFSTITNYGEIRLQDAGASSKLVIAGDIEYKGSGNILFGENISNAIEGGTANTQKLFIDTTTSMNLVGAGNGSQGTLDYGFTLENHGIVKLANFTRFNLNAPSLINWVNDGTIIVEDNANVYLTGNLGQNTGTDEGKLSVYGTLNLQSANIFGGSIQGTGQINAAGLRLENVNMEDSDLTCTGSLTIAGTNYFKSIRFDPGAIMYVSGTADVYTTIWDFANGNAFKINPSGTASLVLHGSHSFLGGSVELGSSSSLCLDIDETSQVVVSNPATFKLDSSCSYVEGTIRAQNGGSAALYNASVIGSVLAEDGSEVSLQSGTELRGEVTSKGTGQVIGAYGTLKGANINGDIFLDPKLKMGGEILGDFTVHFKSPSVGSWRHLEILTGGAQLLRGTTMELSFESEYTNVLITTAQDPLTINSGATLKLTGSGSGSLGELINDGAIVANGLNSGSLSNTTNNGTISVSNGSKLVLSGKTSNQQGSISVDSNSEVDILGILLGGKILGPVNRQATRTTRATEGVFVCSGSLEDVVNSATAVVPDGEEVSIKNSFSNEGLLMIEGGTGKVVFTSQTTTLDGGGEIFLAGGYIGGMNTGTIKDFKLINKDNTIRGSGTIYDYYGYDISVTNQGVIKADQDTQLWLETGVTNEGKIEALGAGGLKASEIINKGEVKVAAGSRLDVAYITQQSGSFQIIGGLGYGDNPVQKIEISGGTFSGGDTTQNLAITGGTFQIGERKFNVKYTYSQGQNGILAVGLGGYNPGVDHGLLLTNTAGSPYSSTNLNGTLIITTASGFEPKPGDEFTFLRSQGFGGLNGKFARVINATPYALDFELVYDWSSVTIRVSALPTLYVSKDGVCGGKKPCYASIQAAFNDASEGSIIKIAQGTYNESPVLNQNRSLIIQGGWNSTYTSQTSNATIIKAPKAAQGSLRLQEITIKP